MPTSTWWLARWWPCRLLRHSGRGPSSSASRVRRAHRRQRSAWAGMGPGPARWRRRDRLGVASLIGCVSVPAALTWVVGVLVTSRTGLTWSSSRCRCPPWRSVRPGRAGRRSPVQVHQSSAVVVVVQLAARSAVLILAASSVAPGGDRPAGQWRRALATGIGTAFLYRGLLRQRSGVVAPISGVPVLPPCRCWSAWRSASAGALVWSASPPRCRASGWSPASPDRGTPVRRPPSPGSPTCVAGRPRVRIPSAALAEIPEGAGLPAAGAHQLVAAAVVACWRWCASGCRDCRPPPSARSAAPSTSPRVRSCWRPTSDC